MPSLLTNQMTISFNKLPCYQPRSEQDYCIYDAVVHGTMEEFEEIPTTKDGGNFDPTTHEFLYDSHVTYYCGLGRAFEKNNGDTVIQQDFNCYWSGTWNPTANHMACICEYIHYIFWFRI